MSLTVGLADEPVICLLGFSFQPVSPINLFFSLEDVPGEALLLCDATAWGISSLADKQALRSMPSGRRGRLVTHSAPAESLVSTTMGI